MNGSTRDGRVGASAAALVVACMLFVVDASLAVAQTSVPDASPGTDCVIADRADLRVTVGPGQARGPDVAEGDDLAAARLDNQRNPIAGDPPDARLDLVTGTDLIVEASEHDIYAVESRPIAVTSVVATLDMEDAPPIWLATEMRDDGTGVIRMPTGDTRAERRRITGDGVLAARVGLCDGSWQAVYGPVVVVGPAAIADCPATWEAVRPYAERLDLRVRVGHSVVPERDVMEAFGRYSDPPPFVGGWSLEGIRYRPATPPVRVDAGEELHVRHIDRDIDLLDPFVRWFDPPPARQLSDGLVRSFENPRAAETRPDGYGGYYVRAPREPGRYLLSDGSTRMNHCVAMTEGTLLVMVEVR